MGPLRNILLVLALPLLAPAQSLNTPADIFRIVQSSTLTYTVTAVDTPVAAPPSLPLNDSYTYQVQQGEGYGIARYTPEPTVAALLQNGEEAFQRRAFREAEAYFAQATTRDSAFAVPFVYLGQCAYNLGELDIAERHLSQALQLNYWDHLGHLSLAHVRLKQGRSKEAIHEAALAYILNPNDPLVTRETKRVFEESGLGFRDFIFHPNYTIERQGSAIAVHMSMPWMMYALCKALWRHEPGYLDARRPQGSAEYNLLEEKECLLNLVASLRDMKRRHRQHPALDALIVALETRHLEQFILVELWMRREPLIVYTQPKELLPRLAEYVVVVRGMKLK